MKLCERNYADGREYTNYRDALIKIIINGQINNTVSSSVDELPYYHKYSQSGDL